MNQQEINEIITNRLSALEIPDKIIGELKALGVHWKKEEQPTGYSVGPIESNRWKPMIVVAPQDQVFVRGFLYHRVLTDAVKNHLKK